MNICYCGAPAGYPHAEDCPYPVYRAYPPTEEKWYRDRASLQAWLVAGKDPNLWEPWD